MRKDRKRIYIVSTFIVLCIIWVAYILPSDNLHLYQSGVHDLLDHWLVELPSGESLETTLPHKYEVEINEDYTATRVFESDFPENMSLRISSAMQDIQVYVGGQLILDNHRVQKGLLHAPEASVWYILPLPEEVQGKTLKLVMSSPVKVFSGRTGRIHYGTNDELKYELFSRQPLGIIMAVVILIIGIILIITALLLQSLSDNRLYYLGMFLVTTSIWLISEMDLLQFFVGSRFIIGGISYLLLPIIPVVFMLYLMEVVLGNYRKTILFLSGIYLCLLSVNLILQLAGMVYFIESIVYVDVFILVTMIALVGMLVYEMVQLKSVLAKRYLYYLGVFILSVFMEAFLFFTKNFSEISSFSRIGFYVFFFLLIADVPKYLNDIIVKEGETQTLRKMAYKDILTKGYNRAAFEMDVDKLLNSTERQNFHLILTDLNDLKKINDTYGHLEGDQAIISCYESLVAAFGSYGKCYRLGGDEFACIITTLEAFRYEILVAKLENIMKSHNKDKKYLLEIAIGSGIYRHSEKERFSEFMHRVDLLMYKNKKDIKTASGKKLNINKIEIKK